MYRSFSGPRKRKKKQAREQIVKACEERRCPRKQELTRFVCVTKKSENYGLFFFSENKSHITSHIQCVNGIKIDT